MYRLSRFPFFTAFCLILFVFINTEAFAQKKKRNVADDADTEAQSETQSATQIDPHSKVIDQLEDTRKNLFIKEPPLSFDQKTMLNELDSKLREAEDSTSPWIVPASSIQTPIGFGASWTDVYAGIGVENLGRYSDKGNGTGVFGFGLGDPKKYVALDVSISQYGLLITPLSVAGISLKLHRRLPWNMALSVGYIDAIDWGNPDNGQSVYTALTKAFVLRDDERKPFSLLTITLGAGDGEFRNYHEFLSGKDAINGFGSIAIRIFRPLSFIINYTGIDFDSGFGIAPFHHLPLSFIVAAEDLTHSAGDPRIRFLFSIAYGDSVVSDSFPINVFK